MCVSRLWAEVPEQHMKKIVFRSASDAFFVKCPAKQFAVPHHHVTVLVTHVLRRIGRISSVRLRSCLEVDDDLGFDRLPN